MATSNAQSAHKSARKDARDGAQGDGSAGGGELVYAIDGPQTCCSTCLTVFQVSPELLESVDTRVRCGECYAIFDALANLVDESATDTGDSVGQAPGDTGGGGDRTEVASAVRRSMTGSPRDADAAALAGLANDTAALDVTYSDFDLFSEDAELPEVAYFDQTRDTPEFDFDSVDLDDDETFSDTLFVNDVTVDARTGDATPLDPPGRRSGLATDDRALPGAAAASSMPRPDDALDASTPSASVRAPLEFRYRDPEPTADEIAVADARQANTRQGDDGRLPDDVIDGVIDVGVEDAGAAAVEPLLIETPRGSGGSWLLRLTMLVLLASLLGALYGYRQRGALADDPFTRPAYTLWCRATGCTVPPRAALDRIELIRRDVYTHPDLQDALVIAVAFRNTAPFEQAYPALVVRLSDPSGRLVARRAFEPSEYLPAGTDRSSTSDAGGTIAAGARLDISLDVSDPGQNATSFEVDFVAAR